MTKNAWVKVSTHHNQKPPSLYLCGNRPRGDLVLLTAMGGPGMVLGGVLLSDTDPLAKNAFKRFLDLRAGKRFIPDEMIELRGAMRYIATMPEGGGGAPAMDYVQ